MGIISDPKQRKKLVDAVARYNNRLCFLCYVVGVGWFLALAYQPLNAKTYFSENALLPGVVDNGFSFDFDVDSTLADFKAALKKDKRKVPRDWVFNKFQEIGLDTYIHNYSISYPMNIVRGQLVPGQNVYGILRARRAASTEAIVLSTPLRAKTSDLPQTSGGVVLMLGLARYFKAQPYWSKDIIFLATDHEQIGMQAWLNGYHDIEDEYIQPGVLPGRSGQIQAALNLEIPDGFVKYFNLKIEGLNGQLPNLDLINLVVRLCRKEHMDIAIHHKHDVYPYEAETLDGFLHSLDTMLKMMWAHASSIPTGNHGLFHRFHIEAVTLEGVRKKKSSTRGNNLSNSGRVVEGICRSLNNLLERFHQSFFFYVLPATERYVSIGLYMPPFGVLCAACLIKQAIALWVGQAKSPETGTGDGSSEEADSAEITPHKGDKQGKMSKEELADIVEQEEEIDDDAENPSTGLMSILPLILSTVLMSVLCFLGPSMLSSMAAPFKMNIEDATFFGFLALFTASLLFPKMVSRKTSEEKRLLFDWELLKGVALIFQVLVLFSLALMNISLAFFLAAAIIPVSIVVHPTKSRLFRWFQKFLLLLISPLSILYFAAVVSNVSEGYENIPELLIKSWSSLSEGLLLTLVDRYFFGSWFFTLCSFAILPNWLTLWGISFCELPDKSS